MDPMTAVLDLGGVARRASLLRLGVTRHSIDAAVRDGFLLRPLVGVVAFPTATEAAIRACYFNGRITCVTAAAALGVRLLRHPQSIHIEVPAVRGGSTTMSPARVGLQIHRTRTYVPGLRTVSASRALDVMAACVGPVAQLVAIDHALALGLITSADIAQFGLTDLRRRRWLESWADPQAGSVSETCARVAMRRAGLQVESQAPIGDWRHADFLVEGKLFVEIDGWSYHGDRRQFDEDRHRDRAIVAAGGHVIRFTYADAVYHPDRLVADVKAALLAIR